jgi:cyclic pyranopterin phosphate synthase
MDDLGHITPEGRPRMVDVGEKPLSNRRAVAQAILQIPPEIALGLTANPKGDPLRIAELAGIMAAKRTPDLIPLAHPLPLAAVEVQAEYLPEQNQVVFQSMVKTQANTGVEMEALTACAIAALTLYDMLKARGQGMVLSEVRLLAKSGGKSDYQVQEIK